MNINVPTTLTLFRLIFSPIFLPILIVYLLPLNVFLINVALAITFFLFSLTDFLDGYLARYLNQNTLIGRVLDPIADKFLIYATLIALLAAQKIFFVWVIIFIGREFFVMGLRLLALEHRFTLRVVWFSKLKTLIQMAYLTMVIVNPYRDISTTISASLFNQIEKGLLATALFLSIWTAYRYYINFVRTLKLHQEQPDQPV